MIFIQMCYHYSNFSILIKLKDSLHTGMSFEQKFSVFHLCRSTSLMQLIALVYKDQHVHKLERLLNDWLETSLSESSEDNESNTSPQDQVDTIALN
jgi:hypothetical protein